MSERDIVEGTQDAIVRLNSIEEFTSGPVSLDVAEFSKFLASRLGNHTIVPLGFIMVAELSIYDLQKGVNDFTGEAIRSDLVGRNPLVYAILRANLPGLARAAFSEKFADAVEEELRATMEELAEEKAKEPAQKVEVIPDPDIITSPIRDISQARHQIVDDAINRTLTLDWKHFGVTDMVEARKLLGATSLLVLRNTEMNFQLNLLDTSNHREAIILESLPDDHKTPTMDEDTRFWLVMFPETISPKEATFIRDWLWVKGPEAIITIKQLPVKAVLSHFSRTAPEWEKAAFRLGQYMYTRGIPIQ